MRVLLLLMIACLLLPQGASAVITFTQLDQDTFTISHRVKVFGSRGKAQKLVYTKASSLCVAAGYSHFRILHQESAASQQYEAANASIRVQYFRSDDDGRIACARNADKEYVEQARAKLVKIGYEPPAEPEETPVDKDAATRSCTVEQITAMVKAGLDEEQIKAACPD